MSDIKLLEGVLADAVDDIGHGHNPVDVIRNAIETATEEEREAREKAGARVAELEARWARLRTWVCDHEINEATVGDGTRWSRGCAHGFRLVKEHMDRTTPAEAVRVTVERFIEPDEIVVKVHDASDGWHEVTEAHLVKGGGP